MAYSAEVLRRARARLAQAREDRASENREHLRLAYAQVPKLLEIDKQLRLTMAQAAQAAFSKGIDVSKAMEEIREQNLLLQQERQALVEQHFTPGYLDEKPICEKCGGNGYVGSQMCQCLQALCRQEQKKELTFLSGGQERFDQFRLDYYPEKDRLLMEKTYRTCLRYAQNFSEKSENLLLSGDTGLGKTFLSACIARTVAENGYSVIYESANSLFQRVQRARFGDDEAARAECEKYQLCDLLIVDDLGTEMPGQFTSSTLYSLINDRILAGKPMIISTNLNSQDFELRYTRQIASRLRGEFRRVPFLGEDIRVLKNQRGTV